MMKVRVSEFGRVCRPPTTPKRPTRTPPPCAGGLPGGDQAVVRRGQAALADQTSPKRVRRQKRFERQLVSLDGLVPEGDRTYEPAAGETPEQAFDRAFARSVIQAVRQATLPS